MLEPISKLFLIVLFLGSFYTLLHTINTSYFELNAFGDLEKPLQSPLHQFKQGIPGKYISCNEGLQLLIKITGEPACVKWEHGKKLLERGWAKSVPSISNYLCDFDCKQKLERQGHTCYEAAKNTYFCTNKLSQSTSQIVIPFNANSPDDKSYIPNSITVSIGVNNTVVWSNADKLQHKIIGDNNEFRSYSILPNQTWTFTFVELGQIGYHDETKPWLHGIINVLPVDMNINKGMPLENWGGEPSVGRYLFRESDGFGYVNKVTSFDDKSVEVFLSYPNGTIKKKIGLGDEFLGICSHSTDFTDLKILVLEDVYPIQKLVQFREEPEKIKKNCNEIFD